MKLVAVFLLSEVLEESSHVFLILDHTQNHELQSRSYDLGIERR